jgi:hypothetical protein
MEQASFISPMKTATQKAAFPPTTPTSTWYPSTRCSRWTAPDRVSRNGVLIGGEERVSLPGPADDHHQCGLPALRGRQLRVQSRRKLRPGDPGKEPAGGRADVDQDIEVLQTIEGETATSRTVETD